MADPGSRKSRKVFALISVLPKPPQLPYGIKKIKFVMNPFFSFVVCQCRRISDNNQTLEILRRHDQL